jgi:hypothetical protein
MIRVGASEFVSSSKEKILHIPVVFDDPSVNWGFSCHKIYGEVDECLWYPPTWLLPPDTKLPSKPIRVGSPWKHRAHARLLKEFCEQNKLLP